MGKVFDWKNTPGQDTYKRFFSKFTHAKNLRVSEYFYTWIFDNFKFDNFTLDVDSSIMTRYGVQEGAKKGYNPAKKGEASHHPLIAFIADVKLVANMWLRSGDASSANNFLSFLEDTLSKLRNKIVSLIRLDSGFFQSDILDYLEEKTLEYIVAVPMYRDLRIRYKELSMLKLTGFCWPPASKFANKCTKAIRGQGREEWSSSDSK